MAILRRFRPDPLARAIADLFREDEAQDVADFPSLEASNLLLSRGSAPINHARNSRATVVDHEGVVWNALAGEMRWGGARRVYNQLAGVGVPTEDFTNAAWAPFTSGDGAAVRSSTFVATVIALGRAFTTTPAITAALGDKLVFTVLLSEVAGAITQTSAFTVSGGTGAFTTDLTPANAVGNGRFTFTATCTVAGTFRVRMGLGTSDNQTTAATATFSRPQVEIVTGQSDQNPSEYVSVGAPKLNELLYTEEMANSYWAGSQVSATANAAADYQGRMVATSIVPNGALTSHELRGPASISIPAGSTVTLAFDVKANGYTEASLYLLESALAHYQGIKFNTATQAITAGASSGTQVSAVVGSYVDLGNGWYRVTATFTTNTVTAVRAWFRVAQPGVGAGVDGAWSGDSVSGMYFSRAQMTLSTASQAYFPVGNVYPFHGWGVDGVKYFDIRNGNTVVGNVVTEARGVPLPTPPLGMQFEPASTNLVPQSQSATMAGWTATGTPAIISTEIVGDLQMMLLEDNDAASAESYYAVIDPTVDGTLAFSVVVKEDTAANCAVGIWDNTAGVYRGLFQITFAGPNAPPLVTPVAGTVEAQPIPLSGNRWRLLLRAAGVVQANVHRYYVFPAGTTAADTGRTWMGVFQAEDLDSSTSPIITTGAAATRVADTMSITSLGTWFNASEGTIVIDGTVRGVQLADEMLVTISDGTTNEAHVLQRSLANAGKLEYVVLDGGGAPQAAILSAYEQVVDVPFRMAASYKLNAFALAVNGQKQGATDTVGTLPTVTRIDIGSAFGTSLFLNGYVKRFAFYNQAASAA